MTTFGEKVRMLRKKKGLTQEALARKAGVSTRTIAGFETENRYPRKRELYGTLADLLGCTRNYLMTDSETSLPRGVTFTSSAGKQVEDAVNTLVFLFRSGQLSETDRDDIFLAITNAYWDAKAHKHASSGVPDHG